MTEDLSYHFIADLDHLVPRFVSEITGRKIWKLTEKEVRRLPTGTFLVAAHLGTCGRAISSVWRTERFAMPWCIPIWHEGRAVQDRKSVVLGRVTFDHIVMPTCGEYRRMEAFDMACRLRTGNLLPPTLVMQALSLT